MSVETNLVPSTAALAPSDALYVTLATNATLTQERVLTGTASQIQLTDNGAGSSVVLSLTGPYTPVTFTAHGVLLGQGASSITAVAVPATTGFYLRSVANTDPIWSTITLPNAATQGDLLLATAANVIGNLADVAAGSYLRSGGVGANPLWSTVTLPNSLVQGDNLVATAANQVGVITAVASGRVLLSQGAGAVPAYTATPTLGIGGSTQGSLALSGVTAGAVTLAVPANVTGSYSFTLPAAAPAKGGFAFFNDAIGTFNATLAPTDGQIPIGATGGTPIAATLTAGAGIVITNAANAITVSTNITGATASTAAPPAVVNVGSGSSVQGSLLRYAREDHTHGLGTMVNGSILQWNNASSVARNALGLDSSNVLQISDTSTTDARVRSPNLKFQAGATAALGTFDNNALNFVTNNANFLTVTSAGVPSFVISPLNFTAGAVFTFGTTDNFALAIKTNGSERARFSAAGGFSIGTTTDPGANNVGILGTIAIGVATTTTMFVGEALDLELNGQSGSAVMQLVTTASSNNTVCGQILFGTSGASSTEKRSAQIQSTLTASSSTNVTGDLEFSTNNAGTFAERMRISAAGGLSLGTTTDPGAANFQFADPGNIVVGTTTGTKIGTSTSQKLGFYNVTPIAQRSGAAQAAIATTAPTQVTPFGYTTSAQATAIFTLANELRAWAVAQGFIAGA